MDPLTFDQYIDLLHGFAGIVCAAFLAYAILHR
jgi:hypothetical protein